MYIPVIKNRSIEYKVLKSHKKNFGDDVIPFIELVNQNYFTGYIIDERGKRAYEMINGKRKYLRKKPVEITLDEIQLNFNDKDVFVQYFRYDVERYGTDYSRIPEAYKLNDDLDLYLNKTIQLTKFSNIIPVLIIKPNVRNEALYEIEGCLDRIHSMNRRVALRVDVQIIDKYKDRLIEIIRKLTSDDYLFIDLLEDVFINYDEEIEDFLIENEDCIKVIMKSYRKRSYYNNQFKLGENITAFDTELFNNYKQYGFDGFSDFCGVQDRVPNNGKGVYSTVLIYNNILKKYISYRSPQIIDPDTDKGRANFLGLKSIVEGSNRIKKEPQFQTCPGIKRVRAIKSGGFKEWKEIAMLTYIHAYLYKKGLVK